MIQNQQSNLFSKAAGLMIENFDIFGQQPTMRILQQKKYTSSLGCLMTLIISFLTLSYLISQILTLQEKSQPKLVISEERILDTPPFPLYNDNFTLAVTVSNLYSEPIIGQFKYYNITVNHCSRYRSINQTTNTAQVTENCTTLPIAKCQSKDWENELQKTFFKTSRLGAMQCIDREALRKNPPAMQGQFSGQAFQYIRIFMTLCKNSSTYQGCAPQEEINSVMQAGHYAVYASDYLLQFNEPDEPYQQFINMDYSTFSLSSSKTLRWIYRIQETHTDDGAFISNDKIISNLRKQSMSEQTDFYNHEFLVCHYIQLDFIKTINQRSYIKMQTILSQVGGFWQILIVIVSLILNPLVDGLMMIQLANQLYRFRQQDPPESHSHQSRLTENTYQSIQLLLGCHKKKRKLFQIAKSDILEKLDIAKILQKIQEIDKLKFLLLNDEQNKLFDLLPKPLIINQQRELYDKNIVLLSNISPRESPLSKNEGQIVSFECASRFKASGDDNLTLMIDKNLLSIVEQHNLKQVPEEKQNNLMLVSSEPQTQQIR